MVTSTSPPSVQHAPGTVTIEDLQQGHLIRQPQPSADPEQPLNWSKLRKSVNYAIVCFYALMTFVLLDIGTVIWSPLNEELGFSFSTLNNAFAANLAGLAVGCIFLIPLAAIFGRRPVYLVSTLIQFATAIWQARTKVQGDLIGSNVVAGIFGAVSESIVQTTISDLFFVHQRATMNAVYLIMVNMGAFLAPIAAGYVAQAQGWRWIWWWTAILLGVCFVVQLCLYEETKYVLTLPSTPTAEPSQSDTAHEFDKSGDKAAGLIKTTTQNTAYSMRYQRKPMRKRLALYTPTPGGTQGYLSIIWSCMALLRFPAVIYTSIIYGSSLAWYSILLTTMSTYFTLPPYNFGPGAVGLMNLPPFIGALIALVIASSNDWIILQLAKRNGGVFEPEMRLWLGLLGVFTAPAGMLLYGLTMAQGAPWIVPALGLGIFGFGWGIVSDVSLTYLQDCYSELVGQCLVLVTFWRNSFSMMIVFVLTPWINSMGLHNMFICTSILGWALYLTTVPMLIWGRKWRSQSAEAYRKLAGPSAE